MVKTSIKDKKAAKIAAEKQADIKLYRLMVEFALSVVALFLVLTAKKNEIFYLSEVMPIFLACSGVLFGLSALFFTLRHAKGVDESERVITSAGIFGNATALLVLAGTYHVLMDAQLIIAMIIAFAVVYMAYSINGEGFFVYSALTAATYISFALSGCDFTYPIISAALINGGMILSFAIPVLSIVFAAFMLVKKNGVRIAGVRISGKLIALAMILTALIALAGAAVALVYFAAAELIMYGMLAFYFLVTVIGIFRMM